MTLNGARIYSEGVSIGHDAEEKINQIVTAIKTLSPSSDVSMRFLKRGLTYEGLLWGKANNIPIGVYNRGPSMGHVLEMFYRSVTRQCKKALRQNTHKIKSKTKTQAYYNPKLALAG